MMDLNYGRQASKLVTYERTKIVKIINVIP